MIGSRSGEVVFPVAVAVGWWMGFNND